MFATVSTLALSLGTRATVTLMQVDTFVSDSVRQTVASEVTPTCGFVNRIQDDDDTITSTVQDTYGLVLYYLPLILIVLTIIFLALAAFAVRGRVLRPLMWAAAAVLGGTAIVGLAGGFSTGPCGSVF